jgi:hypothetical protein
MADKQALGAAHNSKHAHDVVAPRVRGRGHHGGGSPPRSRQRQHGGGSGQRGGSWRGGGGGGGSGQQVAHTVLNAGQARLGSGLCFSHFCFRARAR